MGKSLNGKELGTGITQRKDGKYQARFVNRFGKRVTLYADTVTEIKKKLRTAQGEDDRKENVIGSDMTLNEWFDVWIETYKTTLRISTKLNYISFYNHIRDTIGNIKLCKLTEVIVQDGLNGIPHETVRIKTKGMLCVILEKAVSLDMIKKNVAKEIDSEKHVYKEKVILSKEDADFFLNEIKGTAYYNLIIVALGTGMRIGELCGLMWDDIDIDNQMIYVKRTVNYITINHKHVMHIGDPKTERSKRVIPFGTNVRDALIRQKEYMKNIVKNHSDIESYVFSSTNGGVLNRCLVNTTITRYVKKINEKYPNRNFPLFSSHCLRHTYATKRIEDGMQPKTLQAILGHSSITTTMDLYCHSDIEHIVNEVKKLNDCENINYGDNGV